MVKDTDKDESIYAVSNKLIILLKIKNLNDKNKILMFIKTMFYYSKNNLELLEEKFAALFESIENYSPVDDVFKKKLRKVVFR